MPVPASPLQLGTTGKAIARRLTEGLRMVINRGDDDGTSCGARVPRPSGPPPVGVSLNLTVRGDSVMADADVDKLIEQVGRRLRGARVLA